MLASWASLSPSGTVPTARGLNSGVYDEVDNRLIIYGGTDGAGFSVTPNTLSDVWVLSNADGTGGNAEWTQLNIAGETPGVRGYHEAAYDPNTNRMIQFAGNRNIGSCFATVDETWVLTNANGTGGEPKWQQLTPEGTLPPSRHQYSLAYNATTNRLIAFAGSKACAREGPQFNDVWVLEHANGLGGTPRWTELTPAGDPSTGQLPPVRGTQAAAYDDANNRLIVFGDAADDESVWVLENADGLGGTAQWHQFAPTADAVHGSPGARSVHETVYQKSTNRLYLFGGRVGNPFHNDTWMLENANGLGGNPTWSKVSPENESPNVRSFHTMAFDSDSDRVIVFGGVFGPPPGGVLNDSWVLDVSTNQPPRAEPDSNAVTEGIVSAPAAPVTGNVLTNDTDADNAVADFTITTSGEFAGTYGNLTLEVSGAYTYLVDDGNGTVDSLNVGDSIVEEFSYTMSDNVSGNPKTATGTLSIRIDGSNDAPIAMVDTNSGIEGFGATLATPVTGNVLANDTDVDNARTEFTVTTSGNFVGAYGDLTLDINGDYSYRIDDANATVNALEPG